MRGLWRPKDLVLPVGYGEPVLRVSRSTLVLLVLCLPGAILSCQNHSVKPATQAQSFVAALNARDIESLLRLSADTLLFREQRWETTSDGSGFTLGRAMDAVVSGASRHAFFTRLAARVHVRGATVVERPPARESLLTRELSHADPKWSRLQLFVFLRGEGDVEHTAVTGVDPLTHKVAALYVN